MSTRLTGKTRYAIKTRFLRRPLIVLQVQTHVHVAAGTDMYDGGWTQESSYVEWIDARLEHLTIGEQPLAVALDE